MCLLLFALDVHAEYRLVLAANRDEFHARPTLAARPWGRDPEIIAGRDLQSGGTWLGVTREGRWAAVTNFREPLATVDKLAPSRGHLVSDYLEGSESPSRFLAELLPTRNQFNGFNLVLGDSQEVIWCSNRVDNSE